MYVEKKRERRIRDKRRMKARAVWVAKVRWGQTDPQRAIKQADYIAVCSCDMCGNPRRHFGKLSMQERRNGL